MTLFLIGVAVGVLAMLAIGLVVELRSRGREDGRRLLQLQPYSPPGKVEGCPLCGGEVALAEVGPCFRCGRDPEDPGPGVKNEIGVWSILGVQLILCDSCQSDFDSLDHDFLGFPEHLANNYPLEWLGALAEPAGTTDYYCGECRMRWAFAVAVRSLRQRAAAPADGPPEAGRSLREIALLEQDGYRSSPARLTEAYHILERRWSAGKRDRETTLRLLFLTWYNCVDQSFAPDLDPRYTVEQLFQHLGGESSRDGELLYALAVMAELFPYCCGPEALWARRAPRLRARSARLLSGLPTPERFAGRGAYGSYFEHMVKSEKSR